MENSPEMIEVLRQQAHEAPQSRDRLFAAIKILEYATSSTR
jgi:hypothetical protein